MKWTCTHIIIISNISASTSKKCLPVILIKTEHINFHINKTISFKDEYYK